MPDTSMFEEILGSDVVAALASAALDALSAGLEVGPHGVEAFENLMVGLLAAAVSASNDGSQAAIAEKQGRILLALAEAFGKLSSADK